MSNLLTPKFENLAISRNGMHARFTLAPYHVTYANTLRRVVITGVETVAIKADMTEKGNTTDVTVYRNNTPMTNEMLADRIGLLPLNVKDPLTFVPERYTFTLNAANETTEVMDITASMFEVKEVRADEDEPVAIPTETFFPPSPITRDTALIAVLRPKMTPSATEEGIHIVAKASIGTGRQHARYMPTSQCAYKYTLDDDEERLKEFFDEWLSKHKNVSNPSSVDDEKLSGLKREFNLMARNRCYKIDAKNEAYSFDFEIESVGILPIQYIIKRACDVIETMCAKYSNVKDGELPEELSIIPTQNRSIGFDFLFRGHDHTLGNLFQTWLVDNHIDGEAEPKVTYAGYSVPHPLRDEMVLRIGVDDGQEATARAALQAAARGCASFFAQTKNEWMRVTGMVPPPAAAVVKAAASAKEVADAKLTAARRKLNAAAMKGEVG
jgi:DNA-directed RNA polymerase subunit D